MVNQSLHTSLSLITALIFIIAVGWFTMMDGMFFDGIAYATVSKNLANGIGSFWSLVYNPTLKAAYHDQPPLFFFLQSLLFRLFGDAVWVERVYCLLMAVLNAVIIRAIWNEVFPKHRLLSWFPILLWMCFPVVSWTCHHNLVEITMSAFDLLAVWCMLIGLQRNNMWWLMTGGLFVFLASFCKGFQGLFPVIVPLVYWCCVQRISLRQLIIAQFVVVVLPVLIYTTFVYWPEASLFYENYFETRLARTFGGGQDTTGSRFYLLIVLAGQIAIPVCAMLLILFVSKMKPLNADWKWFSFFGLIGLSASLPLMITLEQRTFYLSTAIPYFALALGAYFGSVIHRWIDNLSLNKSPFISKVNSVLMVILILSILGLPFLHSIAKRDQALLHDLHVLEPVFEKQTIVKVPASMQYNWALHAYFKRYLNVELDATGEHEYFLVEKQLNDKPGGAFHEISNSLKTLSLYQCK